ncbi:restriction endonuclease [Solidesulfovibrio carbinolicus]|uniref:Restriction endonuclease type IV Mrr domain-containing protein n=1 Tax=Solidesulfovibrio carbinolicus TaxID=296842 RepID=A0A4P6HRA4_9BACT|nr:restriction endonuclease [Solidesulfovibrio carbinolicus]QAZ69366.1 hypothetical protein C3Y92_19835 [Solidesulfovibrio carbinolicus]
MRDCIHLVENPLPTNWRDLQLGVRNIFREIGYFAEQEYTIETPRGKVCVDVFAVDKVGDHPIKIISECKNWSERVDQSVVHSFMTVMSETGANIGFIISKNGFQAGALEYTKNTNIVCLTFEDLQEKYIDIWFERYFCKEIGIQAYYLHKYTDYMSSVVKFMDEEHWKLVPYESKCINRLWTVWNARKGFDEHGFVNQDTVIESLYQFSPEIFGDNNLYLREVLKNALLLIQPIVDNLNQQFGDNMVVKMYGKELVGLK